MTQTNLIIPELDNDPAILKVIHDGEKLERETYRKELMQILKIQPSVTSDLDQSISQTMNNSISQESIPTTPGSATDMDRTSQIWIKRTVPITPNSNLYRRQHYRSALHQRSLNSSGESLTNRSLIDSPKSSNNSFIKQTRSNMNLSSSPISNNKTNLMQTNSNISLTPSGVIITDYRQSTMMKRIVNPQWNIIPFA
ncbi:unnamed protein product [Rotaria sp. Silwood1]|nr:unnamed protein product [Rotaria sp. Silwood1]CAF1162396.1 unnamed protein product [Rotaria sp. Silwood1]CAF1166863.1 unnamed protein product [Rotaria sp. Silwood1]CAF3432971.1 unnamed protein product [Rotaria sp. Silwood1]CAF3458730.1 unnamed protein product [Rotaria sp. Silwood1]